MSNNNQQADNSVNTSKPKGRAWGKFVASLLVCYFVPVIGAVCLLLGPMVIPSNPLLGTGVGQMVLALITVLALVFLGGRKWIRFSGKGLKEAFRLSWPILATDVVLVLWSVISMVKNGSAPANAFPLLLGAFVYCLGIAVFEEANFRGILLNGILAPLGKSRGWVIACVIISSLWFGKVHVGHIDMADTAAVALAALKILHAGCLGVIMCAMVLRTREIGESILIHFLHDFLLMGTSVLSGGIAVANYADSSNATAGFVAYGILLAVVLFPTIQAFRSLIRNEKEDHGAFIPALAGNA